jgi:hypothetical protein
MAIIITWKTFGKAKERPKDVQLKRAKKMCNSKEPKDVQLKETPVFNYKTKPQTTKLK